MDKLELIASAYAEAYLHLMRTADRRMAEQGASLAQTKLLLCLKKRGPMRGIDIADRFGQSPRTITEAIDGLERNELVQREPDPGDRRAKLIRITARGVEAAAKTEPLRRQLLEQAFGALEPAEQDELLRILRKLPGVTQPESTDPESTDPESTDPESTDPESTDKA